MKTLLVIWVVAAALRPIHAQIIQNPAISCEYLSWRMTVQHAKARLAQKKFLQPPNSTNSFFGLSQNGYSLMYSDTLDREKIGIALTFSNADSLLSSIMVTFVGIDSVTKKEYVDIDNRMEKIRRSYAERFGDGEGEKSTLFGAKMNEWSLPSTDIQMLMMRTFHTVTFVYSPKSP